MKKKIIVVVAVAILFIIIAICIMNYKRLIIRTALPSETQKITRTQKISFVALGDSLTQGIGDDAFKKGYSERLSSELAINYGRHVLNYNFGKAGDTAQQVSDRIESSSEIKDRLKHANFVVVSVGGNDLQQQILQNFFTKSPDELSQAIKNSQKNYKKSLLGLFATIRHYNSDSPIFLFGNYNPIFVYFPNRLDLNDDVRLYNTISKQVVDQNKESYYVDIFNLTFGQYKTKEEQSALQEEDKRTSMKHPNNQDFFNQEKKYIKNNLISTEDNYHPNSKGYDYMTSQLIKRVKAVQYKWLIAN